MESLRNTISRIETPEMVDDGKIIHLKPSCEMCDGMGLVSRAVPIGHEDFGKAFPCPKCRLPELKRVAYEKLFIDAGIPPSHCHFDFEAFDQLPSEFQTHKRGARVILEYMVNSRGVPFSLAEIDGRLSEFDIARLGVVLSGTNGLGKTALLAGTALAALSLEIPTLFVSIEALFETVRNSYAADSNVKRTEILSRAIEAPFLCGDECGVTLDKVSQHSVEILRRIVRGRAEKHNPMVLTTNLNQSQFENLWGSQIASVINETCHWLVLGGEAIRHEGGEVIL